MAGVYNAVWRSLWSLYLDDMSPGQHLAVMATAGDHRGHSTSTWTTCHLANIWQRWRRPEITVVALPGRHVTWSTPGRSTPGSDGDGRRSLWSLYLDVTSPGQHLAAMATAGDHCGRSTWTTCHLVNTWQRWRRPEITVVALPGRHVTWSTAGSDDGGRRSLWSLYLDAMSPGQHLAVMATAGVTALAILVGGCWTYRHRCRPSDNDSTAADRPHGIIFYHFTSRSCILKKSHVQKMKIFFIS